MAKRKCTKGQTIIYYRYIMEGARWMYIDGYFTQATVFLVRISYILMTLS